MIDRIATSTTYANILANLTSAEQAETAAGNQMSTSQKASTLAGYGAESETITALQATNTQVTGYLNNSQVVSGMLASQSTALGEVAGAAGSTISAITQALSVGDGQNLMASLQDAFDAATEGLNTTFDGEYLFAGGQVNTPPVSATSLSDLTTANPLSSVFANDQLQTVSQIDQNTTLQTGFLASTVATPLFTALQSIQAYVNANGTFGSSLTSAQSQFLTSTLQNLSTVQSNLNNVVGQNGQLQNEVSSTQNELTSQQTMLQGLIGDDTAANLAQASENLQQAQLSIQAAGEVFQALNNSSLVNILPIQASTG